MTKKATASSELVSTIPLNKWCGGDGSVGVLRNELPRSKLTGYQNTAMRIYPKGVTPECFNRASSSGLTWIPDRSIRE
jgi:hypothetical protein